MKFDRASPAANAEPRQRRFRLPYHSVEPVVVVGDILIIVAACLLTGFVYNYLAYFGEGYVPFVERYVAIGFLTAINISAILAARGEYRVNRLINYARQAWRISTMWTGVLLVLVAVAFALKVAEEFSRGAAFTFAIVGLGGLLVWRYLVARFLADALMTGTFAPRNVIVIAEQGRFAISRTIYEICQCGYNPIRTFEICPEEFAGKACPSLRAIIEMARRESVAEILLLIGWEHRATIENISSALTVLPTPVYLLPDDNVARFVGARSVHVGTSWAAELQRAPLTKSERLLKRSFDTLAAAGLLMLLSPLLMAIAILVKLESSGPALFFQTRNGFNGRTFRIVKFRTMHVLEDSQHEIKQATRFDPRVTRLGRRLRRANFDELPQLFNVLQGDMSLVGPRPHAVAHNTEFEKTVANYAFRHHVKPGITGWAQVNGFRGETPTADIMAKRVEFDLFYINNWSFWLDIKILVRTLIVGKQSNAY